MWRPNDWERCTINNQTNYEGLTHAQCFEGGADAMLEALRGTGEHLNKEEAERLTLAVKAGTYVFIPDEEWWNNANLRQKGLDRIK